jgi:hypothetical protein
MRRLILLVVIVAACTKSAPIPVADDRAGYIHKIKIELDTHQRIFDSENQLARKYCDQHKDISECGEVISKLPPLPPQP